MEKRAVISNRITTLTEREQLVLGSIIQNYVLTANPVGSRTLAKKYHIDLSLATIRNTMADLEDMGLLTQQHTSAGRVPTDLGYRKYVDNLMSLHRLTDKEQDEIHLKFESVSKVTTNLFDKVSMILSEVSRLLSVITAPNMQTGSLEKIEIVKITSNRIMVIIVISSGLVRTINLEIDLEINEIDIRQASSFINQRLVGLKLSEIPKVIQDRLTGNTNSNNTIVRLFLDFPDKIFAIDTAPEVHYGYTHHVLDHPEYNNPENLKGVIELLENRNVIVHLLKDRIQGVTVTIGNENKSDQLKETSVITSTYRVGEIFGTLGIIGPTRMNYSRLMVLTEYIAKMVSDQLGK